MNATNPGASLFLLLLAIATVWVMCRVVKFEPSIGRYKSIDGLRGYLAFFVFIHHGCVWYFYLRTGSWEDPPSHLYNHFGPTSVAFFFMITSFLFFGKILDARHRKFNWVGLYWGRVRRIMPLYIVVVLSVFIIVCIMSKFRLQESISSIFIELSFWLVFVPANINSVLLTRYIIAGVVWSLAFEWMFYFSLVVIGRFVLSMTTSIGIYILGMICFILFIIVIGTIYPNNALWRVAPFGTGMIAAFLVRSGELKAIAPRRVVSFLIITLLGLSIWFYPSPYSVVPFACSSICFCLIACGNDLFGLLSSRLSVAFGQISYSIYLLHPIILFVCFYFVMGFKAASAIDSVRYWAAVSFCGVFVIGLSFITYRYIELPFIRSKDIVNRSAGYRRT